jgi:hypothetical protein
MNFVIAPAGAGVFCCVEESGEGERQAKNEVMLQINVSKNK